MKLYFHPASTVCRPVLLFAADANIKLETQPVNIFEGEQFKDAYRAINPFCKVPTLVDGGMKLTESDTILRYLAETNGSAAWPKDVAQRAHVSEMMDWWNTNLYPAFGYHFVYPQTLDHVKLTPAVANDALIQVGRKKAHELLTTLDATWLADGRPFLCGPSITLADYLASGIITIGDWIGQSYSAYPNLNRWLTSMRARPSWKSVNETHDAVSAQFRSKGSYIHLGA
jgi:glutathione S-transferase